MHCTRHLPRRDGYMLAFAALIAQSPYASRSRCDLESLRDVLAARDANRLTKPFYSIPPGPTTFPGLAGRAMALQRDLSGLPVPER